MVSSLLRQEAEALLARLDRVRPFGLQMPMPAAAAPSAEAMRAIERYLVKGRRALRSRVLRFIGQLDAGGPDAQLQRRFVLLKLLFNRVLTQFDLFADVLTQRGEHENGAWLGGLDQVAMDALRLGRAFYDPPPLICYLDRGHGAAIRRARTRLPGGGRNPVSVIRVPRERMVGSGIGASLIHEVGHQGAALLGLVDSLRAELERTGPQAASERQVWVLWSRWISEIVADLWSLAHLGVSATHGLIGVVSLPRAFVFRANPDGPHPMPWSRVKLSCAIGRALFPDPQWDRLDETWERMYPLAGLGATQARLFRQIEGQMPRFVELLAGHRPRSLRGQTLADALPVRARQPRRLRQLFSETGTDRPSLRRLPPTLALAVLGQAKADGRLGAKAESDTLALLLNHWALRDLLRPAEHRPLPKAMAV